MIKMCRKLWLAPVTCLFVGTLSAQGFNFQTAVGPVDSTGYYRIALDAPMVGQMKPDLSDLRIYDAKGAEVPFFVDVEPRNRLSSSFVSYDIVTHHRHDSITEVVLHNTSRRAINNLSLFIANADVQKRIRILGSNDQSKWYSVKEIDWVRPVGNGMRVTELKVVNFPLVDYEFLCIQIDDRKTAPILVQKAGYYLPESSLGNYSSVKATFLQVDSTATKSTWLTLSFDGLVVVDKLKLEVERPSIYLRYASVYAMIGENTDHKQFVASADLRSGVPMEIDVDAVRCDRLLVEIINEDNPPLVVKSVDALMLKRYCIAQLAKGERYDVRFGDPQSLAPRYDIDFFRDKIQLDTAMVVHAAIKAIPGALPKPLPWYADMRIIWSVIALVVVLLGYLTWSMMNKDDGQGV